MQLQEIDRVGFQIFQAAFDEGGEVRAVVTFGSVRVEPPAGLGGDPEFFLPLFAEPGEETFTVAIAVNIRSVEKIRAAIQRAVQRGKRFLVIDGAPGAADGPCAEADGRNFPAGPSEFAVVHSRPFKKF